MLDTEKIKLMTELAYYEGEQGKEDLKISRHYRSDYIGIGLLQNAILITIGYILLWVMIVAYNLDFLLDNLHKINYSFVTFEVVLGYVTLLAAYSVITYIIRFLRYRKAKKSVESYDEKLEQLMKIYGQTETARDWLEPTKGK